MSQKFEVRKLDQPTHERYFGSDFYVDLYQELEHETYSVKGPINLPKGHYIEKPPNGAENMTKQSKGYRSDPTEYKQVFVE